MARQGYTEVSCDYCGFTMDHIPRAEGISVNKWLRSSGKIVSKHGDFCNKECLNDYKSNNNSPKSCAI